MRNKRFPKEIEKSAKDLLKGRREGSGFWHYASIIGVGGWVFVIPIVAGAYLGRFLDGKIKSGVSWTITLIIIGIAAGGYNVWLFYFREPEK